MDGIILRLALFNYQFAGSYFFFIVCNFYKINTGLVQ